MSAVRDLLDRLADIGATLEPAGNRLILRAGAMPVPADMVRRLRQSKRGLLDELAPAPQSANPADRDKTADVVCWRDYYAARLVQWFAGDRRWVQAEAIAYGELLDEWRKSHGRRWPVWQCAGCDKPIGGLSALQLADGNRVHFDDERECLIRFGRRWRDEAVARLQALGLESPAGFKLL
jgi:hypothetical protein